MYPNLNAEMARKNITQLEMTKILDINTSTLSEKMNGKREFRLKECKTIIKELFPNCTMEYLFYTPKDESEE